MTRSARRGTVEAIYGDWGIEDDEVDAKLDQSLNPRPSSMLFDEMARLGIGADDLVLDIGCGDGRKACELARRFGCHVVGVDLCRTT